MVIGGAFDPEEHRNAEELLMRVCLGLNPAHSLLEAVRVLHDDGREAFEKLRGPRCEFAHQWKPRSRFTSTADA